MDRPADSQFCIPNSNVLVNHMRPQLTGDGICRDKLKQRKSLCRELQSYFAGFKLLYNSNEIMEFPMGIQKKLNKGRQRTLTFICQLTFQLMKFSFFFYLPNPFTSLASS